MSLFNTSLVKSFIYTPSIQFIPIFIKPAQAFKILDKIFDLFDDNCIGNILNFCNPKPPVDYCPKPPVDDCEEKPPVDDCKEKPPVDDCEEEPPVDDCEEEPPVDDCEEEPPVDDCEEEPPVDECEEEPPVDECEEEPPVDDCEEEPPVDECETETIPISAEILNAFNIEELLTSNFDTSNTINFESEIDLSEILVNGNTSSEQTDILFAQINNETNENNQQEKVTKTDNSDISVKAFIIPLDQLQVAYA